MASGDVAGKADGQDPSRGPDRNRTTARPSAVHRRWNSLLRGVAGAVEVRGRVPQRGGISGDRHSAPAGEPSARFSDYTSRLRHDEAWRAGAGRGLEAAVRWRSPDSATGNATQWISSAGAAGSASQAQRATPHLISRVGSAERIIRSSG